MLFGPALYPGEELYPSNELYPDAPVGNADPKQHGTIVIDFKRGRGYSFGVHRHEGTISIGLIDNILYYGRRGMVPSDSLTGLEPCSEPFGDCFDTLVCDWLPGKGGPADESKEYDLATGDYSEGLEELTYKSPQFIDGSRTNLKEYEKFRLLFNGNFLVKLILENGDTVVEETISSELSADTFSLLGIPKSNNKSYSITIDIVGAGTVDSIQHTWKPRELA